MDAGQTDTFQAEILKFNTKQDKLESTHRDQTSNKEYVGVHQNAKLVDNIAIRLITFVILIATRQFLMMTKLGLLVEIRQQPDRWFYSC